MTEYTKEMIDINWKILKKSAHWFKRQDDKRYGTWMFGEVWDSKRKTKCVLRIFCGPGFPETKPSLSIMDPKPLFTSDRSKTVDKMGNHEFHQLGLNPLGEVVICHTAYWEPNITLLSVYSKGVLWVEGYAKHLQTGRSIDNFFNPELVIN